MYCCGQPWVGHMFLGKVCDELCRLLDLLLLVETPWGFESIVKTFVRHTASRCLTFTALQEVTWSCGQVLANRKCRYIFTGSEHCKQVPDFSRPSGSDLTHVASLQFLPSGQYGLCFGYFFSGPHPLCSHTLHKDTLPSWSLFRESVIIYIILRNWPKPS